jgi:hypothetical protein
VFRAISTVGTGRWGEKPVADMVGATIINGNMQKRCAVVTECTDVERERRGPRGGQLMKVDEVASGSGWNI